MIRIFVFVICIQFQLLSMAVPPVITEMRHASGKVHLTWRHPSCWDFEVNCNNEGIRKLHIEAGRHGLRQFKWLIDPKPGTNTFAIRAVDEFGVAQEWVEQSLVVQDATPTRFSTFPSKSERLSMPNTIALIRERIKWDGIMPPNPLNTSFRVDAIGTRLEPQLPVVDLVLAWNYTGPVSPNHEVRIYESLDLRDWRLTSTLPTGHIGGFTVEKKPYAFFCVQAFDGITKQPIDGITNLVMDP